MLEAEYLEDVRKSFASYKKMADAAIAQVTDAEFIWKPNTESNSLAVIMQHIGGNLRSRWTDFLASDGEKPWRHRDGEFEEPAADRKRLSEMWEAGWNAVFTALDRITAETLSVPIEIRGQKLTVLQALNRSITHTASHVGQIVYVAKAIRSEGWKTLSIPRGKSEAYRP